MNIGEKGITLIALVITIIIMLILVGVTINYSTNNNGLFNNTKKASLLTLYKELDELLALKKSENMANNNGVLNKEAIDALTIKDLKPEIDNIQAQKFAIHNATLILTDKSSNEEQTWISDNLGYKITIKNSDEIVIPDNVPDRYIINAGKVSSDVPIEIKASADDKIEYGEEDSYYKLYASRSGTNISLVTTNKIDLTNYTSIELNVDVNSDSRYLSSNIYLCVCDDKENSYTTSPYAYDKTIDVYRYTNKTLSLDVSNLSGEHYIKCTLVHGTESDICTSFARINSLKLISNKEAVNKTENYIIKNNTVYYPINSYFTSTGFSYIDNTAYKLAADMSNQNTSIVTESKIDMTKYSSIVLDANVFSDSDYLTSTIYIGLSETLNGSIDFIKQENWSVLGKKSQNKQLTLDVSDISGKYYIKCLINHNDATPANRSYAEINSLKLIKK